jgi:uncharacterized protein YciI
MREQTVIALALALLLAAAPPIAAPAAPATTPLAAPAGTTPGATAAAAPKPATPMRMESYQMVLLWRGPRWTPEVTEETRRIQEQHIGHLQAMGAAGKIVIAGPFSDQPDPGLRGMCLYRAASLEEARALAEKGYMEFPKAVAPASPR